MFLLRTLFLPFFSIVVLCDIWRWDGSSFAGEADAVGLVERHDAFWEEMDSIQIVYTRIYKVDNAIRSFPNCYWESEGSKARAIVLSQTNSLEVFEDCFYNGKDLYQFTVPRVEYPPMTEFRLCDFEKLSSEGYRATFIPET